MLLVTYFKGCLAGAWLCLQLLGDFTNKFRDDHEIILEELTRSQEAVIARKNITRTLPNPLLTFTGNQILNIVGYTLLFPQWNHKTIPNLHRLAIQIWFNLLDAVLCVAEGQDC